jgi:hypothetical protein
MAIVRSILSISLREKSIQLLEHIAVFADEVFDIIRILIVLVIRLTVVFFGYLLATTIGTIRVVYLYARRDDTSLRMEFHEAALIALFILFAMLTVVLIGDSQNFFVIHAWYFVGNFMAGYLWFECIKWFWEWMDSLFGKPTIKRKEKAKKPKINSRPLDAYWIHIILDLEKAARLMVSRHLNAIWKELLKLWYTTPFIPICLSAFFGFALACNVASRFVVFFVLLIPFMLIREVIYAKKTRTLYKMAYE